MTLPEWLHRLHARLRELLPLLGLDQARCVHCYAPVDLGLDDAPRLGVGGARAPLCPLCVPQLPPYDGPRCPVCGEPGPYASASLCPQCHGEEQGWDRVAYYGLYEGWLRDSLLRFKFDGELAQGPFLAACLLQASQCLPRPDVIQAIPQHKKRLRKRGFNQAHEVAKALGKLAHVPVEAFLLQRVQEGPLQHTLSAKERRTSVTRAFAASPDVRGKAIWLVDDIMTTGATLSAAARTLKKAGAASVHCLVVARTPRDGDDSPA